MVNITNIFKVLKYNFSHKMESSPIQVPCCEKGCNKLVRFDDKIVRFGYKNCICCEHPAACNSCRTSHVSTVLCRWCHMPGRHTSFTLPIQGDLQKCMRAWGVFRTECSHGAPQLAKMAERWDRFLLLYNMFAVSCEPGQKNAFLMRFLRAQMGPQGSNQASYIVWKMGKWFYFMLKQASLARILVCNLSRVSGVSGYDRTALFKQSYFNQKLQFYPQEMMHFVLRRIIAIITHWHQLSIMLKD